MLAIHSVIKMYCVNQKHICRSHMACRPLVCNCYSELLFRTFWVPEFPCSMAAPVLSPDLPVNNIPFHMICILNSPTNTTFLEWPYLNKFSLKCEWWIALPKVFGWNHSVKPWQGAQGAVSCGQDWCRQCGVSTSVGFATLCSCLLAPHSRMERSSQWEATSL